MSKVAVIGYASIDFPAVLDGFFAGDRTVMIRQRPADAFPRPGGCPLYVARPIARAGMDVSIVTWVGADSYGELFAAWTENDGVGAQAIATVEAGNTPVCFVIYQKDGSCGCLFDPGMLGREKLTRGQRERIAAADLFCVTVGPPEIAGEALELITEDCRVAWVMKNDPLSFPLELRKALAARADYIFCNRQERAWVDEGLAAAATHRRPLIVETAGGEAVKAEWNGAEVRVDVQPLWPSTTHRAPATRWRAAPWRRWPPEKRICDTVVVKRGIESAASLLRERSPE